MPLASVMLSFHRPSTTIDWSAATMSSA